MANLNQDLGEKLRALQTRRQRKVDIRERRTQQFEPAARWIYSRLLRAQALADGQFMVVTPGGGGLAPPVAVEAALDQLFPARLMLVDADGTWRAGAPERRIRIDSAPFIAWSLHDGTEEVLADQLDPASLNHDAVDTAILHVIDLGDQDQP